MYVAVAAVPTSATEHQLRDSCERLPNEGWGLVGGTGITVGASSTSALKPTWQACNTQPTLLRLLRAFVPPGPPTGGWRRRTGCAELEQ